MTQFAPGSVLLDASNLAIGGGVQVAASLVDELIRLSKDSSILTAHPWLNTLRIEVSPQVAANITESISRSQLAIRERHWYCARSWLSAHPASYELQFTVFGPRYGRRRGRLTVTGIADVTSVYPWPAGIPVGTLRARIKRAVRGWVSRQLFRRETILVSESRALLREFEQRTGYDPRRTRVIPNTLNRIVLDPVLQEPIGHDMRAGLDPNTVLFAYVARAYPHKNHAFLPPLVRELARLGIVARIVVTLTDQEWDASPESFRQACVNVGVIPVSMIADLNRQCDAAIFPSLLESFSATPLEAMSTNGLLFASDRQFVRDVCGDAAVYIDPLDARRSAHMISQVLANKSQMETLRRAAARNPYNSASASDRALAYVCLITDLLERDKPFLDVGPHIPPDLSGPA